MFRSILLVAALTLIPAAAQAADPKVTSVEWKSDLGGDRYFKVVFSAEPTVAASDKAAALVKAFSLSEGYVLNGTAGSSPGKAKNEREFTVGYKKAGPKPVLVKVEFVNQVAGIVSYKFLYTQKADATTVTKHAETLARAAYDVDPADTKVKAKTETKIDEKNASVTVTFTGGKFDLIRGK